MELQERAPLENPPPVAVVVMGVTGCGKSTVGAALANELGAVYIDADAHHPASNIAKMAAGTPLDDLDRWPWLDVVAAEIARALASGSSVVCACSALRRAYRDRLRATVPGLVFVHLAGSRDQLAQRVRQRTDHFMPASLLDSQLATLEPLEPGESGTVIGTDSPLDQQIATARSWLGEHAGLDARDAVVASPGQTP